MTTTTTEHVRKFVEYVGIDPSLTATGICIIDAHGKPGLKTIRTKPETFNHDQYFRLDFIADSIRDMIEKLLNPVVFIERPFVNPKNVNDAQRDLYVLAHLIRRRLHYGKKPFLDISPMTLKKFVCGRGNSEKSMMLMKVYQNWDISAADDNQADAVGLAHMAKAMEVAQGRGNPELWPKYQLEVVRNMLAKGKS